MISSVLLGRGGFCGQECPRSDDLAWNGNCKSQISNLQSRDRSEPRIVSNPLFPLFSQFSLADQFHQLGLVNNSNPQFLGFIQL